MKQLTWNEYKEICKDKNAFRLTHYSALFNSAHCRANIKGLDFILGWDLRDYQKALEEAQAHLSTGLSGIAYNTAINNVDHNKKMVKIYNKIVELLPVFADDVTKDVQAKVEELEANLALEIDFYKKRIIQESLDFYSRILIELTSKVKLQINPEISEKMKKGLNRSLVQLKLIIEFWDSLAAANIGKLDVETVTLYDVQICLHSGLCKNARLNNSDLTYYRNVFSNSDLLASYFDEPMEIVSVLDVLAKSFMSHYWTKDNIDLYRHDYERSSLIYPIGNIHPLYKSEPRKHYAIWLHAKLTEMLQHGTLTLD